MYFHEPLSLLANLPQGDWPRGGAFPGRETDSRLARAARQLSIAEPCFPVQIAHGHVHSLLHGTEERPAVDLYCCQNVIGHGKRRNPRSLRTLCPWNQTLPLRGASPRRSSRLRRPSFLHHTLYFRAGREHVKRQLAQCFERLGVSRRQSNQAAESGLLRAGALQQAADRGGPTSARPRCAPRASRGPADGARLQHL